MKTLSVKQPWSYLICSGVKPVENRTWNTKFRGRVLIHSSARKIKYDDPTTFFTPEQLDEIKSKTSHVHCHASAIIGSVEIVNCISVKRTGKGSDSIWAEKGCYHWILRNPVLFKKPILNVKGKLSFWDYPMTEEEYLKIEKL